MSKESFEPTIEDFLYVNEKLDVKVLYHRDIVGLTNFRIFSMDNNIEKWNNCKVIIY